MIQKHRLWVGGAREGERADFSGANLNSVKWKRVNLHRAIMVSTNLMNADLSGADLSGADLRNVFLNNANLVGARLTGANLRGANLHAADFSGARLIDTDLSDADLSEANLSRANLSRANLSRAVMYETNLNDADLSDTNLKSIDFSSVHKFEKIEEGVIAYKIIGHTSYPLPQDWVLEEGSTIESKVDTNLRMNCSYGINVATWDWVKDNPLSYRGQIWKVLVSSELIVPYNSDGRVRCKQCKLLEKVGVA